MKLKVITYDGEETFYDATSFEFRSNQVTNWIKIKTNDSEPIYIHNICVVKTVE